MTHFKNKKVIIMGLGLHGGGAGAAKFFSCQGAEVLVTDLKTKEQLKESIEKLKGLNIKYVLGGHREEDFINADLIIKNPDVAGSSPFLKIAKKNNIPVETDLSLFFKLSKAYIIGVTGTKGKSTVASLIYHFLKTKYPNTFLAGNIGVSVLEIISKVKKGDKVVLELSSFELEDLKTSPNMAIITNIMPDHLNRYRNMADYIKAKKLIFKYQGDKDILVLNYDDKYLRKFSSKSYFYSLYGKPKNPVAYLSGNSIYFSNRKKATMEVDDYQLLGKHNLSNLLAAVSAAKLLNVPCDNIKKSVRNFKGVHSRQELVKIIKGVRYYNDTAATMPEATIEAIKSFKGNFPKSKMIIIAGGVNKGLDYKKMAEEIDKKVDCLVLLPGTASDQIKRWVKKARIFEVSSMKEAVEKSRKISSEGDIVFLSPGAASFNLFKNEFDRGGQFIKFVLKNK